MKRLIFGISILTLLAGCSSPPTKEQDGAAVEDRTKPKVVEQPPIKSAPTTKPIVDPVVSGNPLKDPGNILSKRSIFFDYDSNLVKDEFKPIVTAHARYLQQNQKAKMRIEGNADDRGSREYNLALGQRRAEPVKKMMTVQGVQDGRIETVSFGEEKPMSPGHDEQAWSQNRRADIKYAGE